MPRAWELDHAGRITRMDDEDRLKALLHIAQGLGVLCNASGLLVTVETMVAAVLAFQTLSFVVF